MKLVGFLAKLRNEQVCVELKNGSTVWGTLQNVSPAMNVILTEVTLSLPEKSSLGESFGSGAGSLYLVNNAAISGVYMNMHKDQKNNLTGNPHSTTLQYINIRGNTIRQIILPESLNLDALLKEESDIDDLNKLRKRGKVVNSANKKRKITQERIDDATPSSVGNKRIKR
ncbi:hypothetical protein ACO0RG_000272 [Hanseniaspora osmophila]